MNDAAGLPMPNMSAQGGLMGAGDPAGLPPSDMVQQDAWMGAGTPGGIYPGIHIPTGDELYNQLMQSIEPELTTAELPLLDDRYKTETAQQSKERAQRYQRAFAEYDRQLQAYMGDLQAKLHAHQRIALSSAELGAKTEEEEALTAIESNIAKSV